MRLWRDLGPGKQLAIWLLYDYFYSPRTIVSRLWRLIGRNFEPWDMAALWQGDIDMVALWQGDIDMAALWQNDIL